jgi:hypothetical protein
LGGELGVNSTFGAGTSFWFKLDPALAVEYAAV